MENEALVRQTVEGALNVREWLTRLDRDMEHHSEQMLTLESLRRWLTTRRETLDKQIHELKFHDIGHASGELNKLDKERKEQACQPKTSA